MVKCTPSRDGSFSRAGRGFDDVRIGLGQFICLVLGVFLVALGAGRIGGRLSAQMRISSQTERPSEAARDRQESAEPGQVAPDADGLTAAPEPEPPPAEETAQETSHVSEAAAPAVPAPGTEQDSKYVIQALSTSRRDDAKASREKIMAAGFPAGIFEVELAGKGKWYRVCIGPYETEAEARSSLESVSKIPGFRESFVRSLD